jgi:hypothetical protein
MPSDIPLPPDRLARILQIQPLADNADTTQIERRAAVVARREYYQGTQYGRENVVTAENFANEDPSFDVSWQRLPEHVRLHNYSDHCMEGVDFLADQITGNYRVTASDQLAEWIDQCWVRSGLERRKQELAREPMIAGDVFVNVVQAPHPDESKPQAVWHLWEAETVEVDYDPDDWQRIVELRTEEHRLLPDPDDPDLMVEQRWVYRYRLEDLPIPLEAEDDATVRDPADVEERFVQECVRDLEIDGEFQETVRLGLPFIPWVHVHGENEALRSAWGRPLITGQVMETVDRYNAVCQLEFQAVRYNSFGNAVVVGDEMYLRERAATAEGAAFVVSKDVADLLVVPGGTNVEALNLTINVEAYKSQRDVLIDEIFGLFGLERIDAEKLRSFGGVSGYALEILNRKTDGTFNRIVENQKEGHLDMINMGLDVDAYVRESREDFWNVDPLATWPDREIEVDFGTAYIVDEVAVRDDFVAGIISQQEALRLRGYTDDEIEAMMAEMEDEEPEPGNDEAALQQGERFSTERA